MSNTIMIWQNKGGVGKSTTTTNLSSGIAITGKKTVIISGDSQNDSLWMLGKNFHKGDPGLKAMVHGKDGIIRVMDNLDYIPLEVDTFSYKLKSRVEELFLKLEAEYDYIFIDCSPSISDGLIKIFSKLASKVLVPCELDELSFNAIERMTDGIVDFDKVKYILPTLSRGKMTDEGFIVANTEQKWLNALKEISEISGIYLGTPIPYRTFQKELTSKRKTIWESNSKNAELLQEAYMEFIEVMLSE